MQRIGAELNAASTRSALIAAAMMSGLMALVINLQPIIMGALATGRGLTDANLGQISAMFIGANTMASLLGPWWVRRLDWRLSGALGVGATILSCFSGIFAGSFWGITLVFIALGLSTGVVGAVAFASLGDSENTDRAYGAAIIAQASVSAIAATPMSGWVVPTWGIVGLFVALAAMSATCFLALPWLPARGRGGESAEATDIGIPMLSARAVPAFGAIVAGAIFTAGILGFWYFIERIGSSRGLSPQMIGFVISLSSVSTIVTATTVAWLGTRLSSMAYMWIGSTMVLSGYGLVLWTNATAYVVGVQLFAFGWGFAQPAYYALARKVDRTGRLFVAAPGATGIAGVAIGFAAGPVLASGGYSSLIVLSAILIAIAAAVVLLAVRLAGSASAERSGDAPSMEEAVREPPLHLLHANVDPMAGAAG